MNAVLEQNYSLNHFNADMRMTYKPEKLSMMSCALGFLNLIFRLAYQSRR